MKLDFINISILFGAIQGFLLCWILFKKKQLNVKALNSFILFLFSLSFLNLFYALLDSNILNLYKPLYVFPFPYRYLIGVGFFLYINYSFQQKDSSKKSKWLLYIPALIFTLLHIYWFSISVYENSYRIISEVVKSNFFRINEYVYLFYTIILVIFSLKTVLDFSKKKIHRKNIKNIRWLKHLSIVFLTKLSLDLILFSVDLILHDGKESLLFFYPNFILNTIFIYWIGYIGFIKPHLLVSKIKVLSIDGDSVENKLSDLMTIQEIYRNKKLTLSNVAALLSVKEQDLSSFINDKYMKNFSEFINEYRINKVKQLIETDLSQKYTMSALAEQAGFNSKSSFNSIFKKQTGITPTEYKKTLQS